MSEEDVFRGFISGYQNRKLPTLCRLVPLLLMTLCDCVLLQGGPKTENSDYSRLKMPKSLKQELAETYK